LVGWSCCAGQPGNRVDVLGSTTAESATSERKQLGSARDNRATRKGCNRLNIAKISVCGANSTTIGGNTIGSCFTLGITKIIYLYASHRASAVAKAQGCVWVTDWSRGSRSQNSSTKTDFAASCARRTVDARKVVLTDSEGRSCVRWQIASATGGNRVSWNANATNARGSSGAGHAGTTRTTVSDGIASRGGRRRKAVGRSSSAVTSGSCATSNICANNILAITRCSPE